MQVTPAATTAQPEEKPASRYDRLRAVKSA
jgi:hypothetical protein